uniref:Carbamoyl phosphate synthase ATP-binding domain-containing protein n=1 Tax=Lactuca sativa TaxID=4236 RepID=A0A9R1VI02_LACSA|nr:hypothetical protein LSAT_V11C500276610 [Lactuca sativa]
MTMKLRMSVLQKKRDEFVKILQQAQSEAAAFRNDGVYLEKYIQNPRHIEFQVSVFVFFVIVKLKRPIFPFQLVEFLTATTCLFQVLADK